MNKLLLNRIQIMWDRVDEDRYFQDIPAIQQLDALEFHKPITIFAGENGTGKSTLLEGIAIAYGFNPEGGTRNYSFSTYDSHSELHKALRLSRGCRPAKWGYFLRAESLYNVATMDEEYARIGHMPSNAYHKRSHGEAFLAIAQDNFQGDSIYLLDEPEAALSPQRQLTLLAEIIRCCNAGSQFIIASHSPILLGLPDAEILSFDNGHIHPVTYEETSSYQVVDLFLRKRAVILEELMRDMD